MNGQLNMEQKEMSEQKENMEQKEMNEQQENLEQQESREQKEQRGQQENGKQKKKGFRWGTLGKVLLILCAAALVVLTVWRIFFVKKEVDTNPLST